VLLILKKELVMYQDVLIAMLIISKKELVMYDDVLIAIEELEMLKKGYLDSVKEVVESLDNPNLNKYYDDFKHGVLDESSDMYGMMKKVMGGRVRVGQILIENVT
jgi:hypothetical protein